MRKLTAHERQELRAMFMATGDELTVWEERLAQAERDGEPEFYVWLNNLEIREGLEYLRAPEPPAIVSAIDALVAANEIARNASGTNIDWKREPLSDREAKIRGAMLGSIRARFFKQQDEGFIRLGKLGVIGRFIDIGAADNFGDINSASRGGCDHLASDARALWIELFDADAAQQSKEQSARRRRALTQAIAKVDAGELE